MSTTKAKAGKNRWNYSGTVLKKYDKYSPNGNRVVSLYIEIPANNPKYSTKLWLKAFNSTKDTTKNIADQVADTVVEGNAYDLFGYTKVGSYEKDGQKIYKQDFVINKFEEAEAANTPGDGAPVVDEDVPF